MDTDGGDHPCIDLTCHLMPAYLHGTRRGRRAFCAFRRPVRTGKYTKR